MPFLDYGVFVGGFCSNSLIDDWNPSILGVLYDRIVGIGLFFSGLIWLGDHESLEGRFLFVNLRVSNTG